jgi:hypothetical protein
MVFVVTVQWLERAGRSIIEGKEWNKERRKVQGKQKTQRTKGKEVRNSSGTWR